MNMYFMGALELNNKRNQHVDAFETFIKFV